MPTKTITWPDGSTATLTFSGQGNGTITVQSDPNNHYEARSAQVTVKTTDGSNIQRIVTISQAAKVRTDISNAVVTAANQTYSGTAKTPIPTVTLNGETIPSSGYDVAYSNNTNAGTATITVTGKGDYTGTATGTFTINQATGQVTTVPTARSVTYNSNTQYLITAGAGTGTMYYRYKLSTSSTWSSWSSTRARATDAGTYDIEYVAYASSDGNYTTSPVGSLSVTMAKASRTLSFADAYAVVAPSGTVTKTATPSAGSGDGAITYTISSTTYATINSSTGAVTAKTSDGSAVVTATIAEGTNYLSATASYNLYVFATTHNFAYTGSVQNIALPPGSYKLQCWGAQGGSNAAAPSYGITSKSGGKGGYSEGILTIAAQTTLYAFVGGQGSSSGNGGWNGGGGGSGSSSYESGDTMGTSRMGCGGGSTDFSLVTSSMSYSSYRNNRSAASLLARMIVAGGGSGGAMCYKKVTTTTTSWETIGTINCNVAHGSSGTFNGVPYIVYKWGATTQVDIQGNPIANGTKVRVTFASKTSSAYDSIYWTSGDSGSGEVEYICEASTATVREYTHNYATAIATYYRLQCGGSYAGTITIEKEVTTTAVTETNDSQDGYVGGGTSGDGYSSTYKGRQNAAGTNGEFGKGANDTATNYRYCAGCGGGGWYGGGSTKSNSTLNTVKYSGGGSGFVNTAANAQYRPSGYTGIELDSGSTTAGSSSFPSTGGGTETGHSGNGYAKITRLS